MDGPDALSIEALLGASLLELRSTTLWLLRELTSLSLSLLLSLDRAL